MKFRIFHGEIETYLTDFRSFVSIHTDASSNVRNLVRMSICEARSENLYFASKIGSIDLINNRNVTVIQFTCYVTTKIGIG